MVDKEGQARNKTRLAEELRANLARRKAQTRSRRAGEADTRNEGLVTSLSGLPAGSDVKKEPE